MATGRPLNEEARSLERATFDHGSADSSKRRGSTALVQITFVALGVCSLLPWNAIITVLPFFLYRLRGTSMQADFSSWLSFLFNGVCLAAMGLATCMSEYFTCPSSLSLSIASLACLFMLLAAFPFLDFSPLTFFLNTLVISSLLSAVSGFVQTSTVALAPRYGTVTVTSYMVGCAISAIGVSLLQVVTASAPTGIAMDSASRSAAICFAISAIVTFLTLVLYRTLGEDCDDSGEPERQQKTDVEVLPSECTQLLKQSSQPLPSGPLVHSNNVDYPYSYIGCCFAAFYIGLTTLCVFPAITATIESTGNIDPLVFNAMHFLVLNVGDLGGRLLVPLTPLYLTANVPLITYSLARTALVPFFILCKVAGSSAPSIITSDTAYMLGVFVLGLTHGHASTLSLVAAAQLEGRLQRRGRATQLAQFATMVGITAGGGVSFGIRAAS